MGREIANSINRDHVLVASTSTTIGGAYLALDVGNPWNVVGIFIAVAGAAVTGFPISLPILNTTLRNSDR